MRLMTGVLLLLMSAGMTTAIPETKPVKSRDYQIGVYYFPGWNTTARWMPIDKAGYPRPLLGYYREGDPEVAEWHLKWAAEHGINFFIYDWYWNRGSRSLDHALHQGYFQAKNRKYVQFCLLWANHNAPGSHSVEDLLKVTDYWIENYFKRPEYYKIDGKPMVIFFTTGNLRRDLGSTAAVKDALLKVREKVKAAGFPDIYLVASQDFNSGNAGLHKEEGWDAATTYNYPGAGRSGPGHASYRLMVEGYERIWKGIDDNFQIPYMVPIISGWDNTPWSTTPLVRFGTSAVLFEEMCRRARRFMDERPAERAPRIVICEAWNEFGEGSYVEPTRQFGFGYLDALRRVFTNAPDRHDDITPQMLGQQVPQVSNPISVPNWQFETGADGWEVSHGIRSFDTKNGCLVVEGDGSDPAIFTAVADLKTNRYTTMEVRMKTDKSGVAQLFWTGSSGPASEANSQKCDLIADGDFHVYRMDLSRNSRWTGTVNVLRFDPNSAEGATSVIDYICLK